MSRKHRKMLNDWKAPFIQALARQIETQSKDTLARWALAYHRLGTKAGWDELELAAGEECERMLEALLEVSVPDEPKPARIRWQC